MTNYLSYNYIGSFIQKVYYILLLTVPQRQSYILEYDLQQDCTPHVDVRSLLLLCKQKPVIVMISSFQHMISNIRMRHIMYIMVILLFMVQEVQIGENMPKV